MEKVNGPLQLIFSLEGLTNGVLSHDDILTCGRPPPYDLSNFEERVRYELERHKALGLGGVVINFGYADDYLRGEAGWQRFLTGLRVARQLGLRVWIYDEKGYPSGTAGGQVLEANPQLEAVGMKHVRIQSPRIPVEFTLPDPQARIVYVRGIRPDGMFEPLVVEKADRSLRAPENRFDAVDVYFTAPLFEGTHAAHNLAMSRRYINVLDRKAVNCFLRLTHVRYLEKIPADLRHCVDAFFSDEVSLMAHALVMDQPVVQQDPVNPTLPLYPCVPWSDDLEVEFLSDHGYTLVHRLPSLFEGQSPEDRKTRRDFRRTVTRLYADAFARQSADVCEALGVKFAGHLLAEETILQQVVMHGSLIQVLKPFHRPGVDLLTCRVDLFANHILTHKTAQSALFLGNGTAIMSETSDYMECWGGDKKGAPLEEIKCVLALQYLLGVRDFCFAFLVDRFKSEEYLEICTLATRLNEIGGASRYKPQFALYYPTEEVWERYVPCCPTDPEICSAGIFGKPVSVGSNELETLNELTTRTVNRLFLDNRQYLLCERSDVAKLAFMGLNVLAYYGPDDPDAELKQLCRQAGVELVSLADYERAAEGQRSIETGPETVYATNDDFVFAVNTGRRTSFIKAPGWGEAVFPLTSEQRHAVSGPVELAPLSCVFQFRPYV